jgi:glutathione S-transferase
MNLKMYHDSNCPYSRKVLIMASEHRLGEVFDFESPFTKSGQEAIAEDNPLAKMPALVISPGFAIFDSRVICRYIDSLRGDRPSFYPAEGMALWQALRYEALGDGMLDAAIAARQELSRPKEHQIPERVDKQLAKVNAGLRCLERELDSLEGPVTVGMVAVSNALTYLDFRWAHLGWRARHPDLATWRDRIESRDAFIAHPYVESDLLLKKLATQR